MPSWCGLTAPFSRPRATTPKSPEVYGHPDDVRGKTILAITVSSSHFALSHWLRVLGLKDSDVTIKNMDQAQARGAFSTGIGDMVSLWAPHMYVGEEKGWKVAGSVSGMQLPICW